jgi:hypothetical protein
MNRRQSIQEGIKVATEIQSRIAKENKFDNQIAVSDIVSNGSYSTEVELNEELELKWLQTLEEFDDDDREEEFEDDVTVASIHIQEGKSDEDESETEDIEDLYNIHMKRRTIVKSHYVTTSSTNHEEHDEDDESESSEEDSDGHSLAKDTDVSKESDNSSLSSSHDDEEEEDEEEQDDDSFQSIHFNDLEEELEGNNYVQSSSFHGLSINHE